MRRQISKTKKQYEVYLDTAFQKSSTLCKHDQPIFYSTVYLTPLTTKTDSFQLSVPLNHFESHSRKNLMLNYRVKSIDQNKRTIHCYLYQVEAYNTIMQGSKVSYNISVEVKNEPFFLDLKVLLNKKVENAKCSIPVQKLIRALVQNVINERINKGCTIEDLFLELVNKNMVNEIIDLINLNHTRLSGFIKTIVISRIKTTE